MIPGEVKPAPIPILVAEDDPIILESLAEWLADAGYRVFAAADGQAALEILERERMWLLVTDLRMPGMSGVELLARAREILPDIYVIIVTAYGTISSAVDAIRAGAFDFIEKPFCPEKIEELLARAVAHKRLLEEQVHLREKPGEQDWLDDLLGKSNAMRKVFELIRLVAASNVTVLIEGESGTGKELAARAIHRLSPRAARPFITTACASLPESLLESELFGHEKGSFTGATERKRGTFELATGGTLFLDEIGEISANTQVHLLRVLEERAMRRVGGVELIPLDIRVVSATNRDLMKEVESGRFREDLYYRLNVMRIDLPPLRERRVDIMPLADHFLDSLGKKHGLQLKGFTSRAFRTMLAYDWPGNVRELQNAVERAIVVARGEFVDLDDLPERIAAGAGAAVGPAPPPGASLKDVERQHILHVLEQANWNRTKAARILGIQRMTLYNKMREYEIEIPEKKTHADE